MSYNVVTSTSGTASTLQPQKKKKTEWPEALKLYVGRAFENVEDNERPALETYLKDMITLAFETSSVWTTDWANEPLPVLSRPLQFQNILQVSKHANGSGSAIMPQNPLPHNTVVSKRKKSRFDVSQGPVNSVSTDSEAQKAKRARRFEDLAIKSAIPPVSYPLDATLGFSEGVLDYDEHTIIGQATNLEKSYLRLTSAPDPGTVRPLNVLKDTLELLKRKWKENANYAYICDQFKSLRQDLTVQRIKHDFTINVYEIHARIALEKSDLGEYNQCQSQLQSLYHQIPSTGHPLEFLAYRILYMLHTRNFTEINTVLINLTPALRTDPSISHALSVRKALACNNYPRLFRLYLEAPNMSGYLMDNFVDRERIAALSIICRACRPTLEIDDSLAKTLGFPEVAELKEFLTGIDDDELRSAITRHGSQLGSTEVSGEPPRESFDSKKAGDFFEKRKHAMGGVDIKGQI